MKNAINTPQKSKNQRKVLNENNPCKTKANDFFIETIIENIEKMDLEKWRHFFNSKALNEVVPYNPISKTTYKGINAVYLMLVQGFNQFETNQYATFKQISEAGGTVRKGSKGFSVEYYNFMVTHIVTKEKITMEEYRQLNGLEKENYSVRFYNKTYRVFNLDQTDGLSIDKLAPFENEFTPIDEIDLFLNQTIEANEINVKFERTNQAFYRPSNDSITLPLKKYFISSEAFYSTSFHEIIHWTGAEKRLDRDMSGFFGNNKYAFEELVAELGAMLILNDFYIYSEFANSLAYLKSWLKNTSEENKSGRLREAFKLSNQAHYFLKKAIS